MIARPPAIPAVTAQFFTKKCAKSIDTRGEVFYILQNVKDVTRVGVVDDSRIGDRTLVGVGLSRFHEPDRGRG
jgi:hypothetical protein